MQPFYLLLVFNMGFLTNSVLLRLSGKIPNADLPYPLGMLGIITLYMLIEYLRNKRG